MEFAGIPVLAPTQGYRQQVQRGQSYYRGFNDNRATITAEQLEKAFKQFKTNFAAPKIDKSKRYNKREDVSSILGAPSVITSLKGAPRTHGRHGGIDIGCDPGLYISLRGVDAEVVGTKSGGGYGNVIDIWIPSLRIQLRFAHNNRILISNGRVPAGTSFATTGYTGNVRPKGSNGSHIHLEASTERGSADYGGNTSPNPYVKLIQLSRANIQGQPGTIPDLSGYGGTSISSTAQGTTTANAVSEGKRGQVIPIPIPQASSGGGSESGGGEGGESTTETVIINPLNSFVTKTLLMELEYT